MAERILPPAPPKPTAVVQNPTYSRYVILGNDVFSIACWYHLVFGQKRDAQLFCWSASPQRLTDWFWQGPSWLRGQVNKKAVQDFAPHLSLKPYQDPLFYKETQWRSFHSRMKPQPLLGEEAYFTAQGLALDWYQLYPFLGEDKLLEHPSIQSRIPRVIRALKAEDPISPAWWQIEFSDGSAVQCQDLIWGGTNAEFKGLYQGQERPLADQLIAHIMQPEPIAVWALRFELDSLPELMANTFFIPLSYTYDEGHFIGEVEQQANATILKVMRILQPQEATEEQAAKDHRYLKRILQKIFGLSKKQLWREQGQLKMLDVAGSITDEAELAHQADQSHLAFIGMSGLTDAGNPLLDADQDQKPENFPEVSYVARGILSVAAAINWVEQSAQASAAQVPAEEKEVFTDSIL